ncbi:hypothetical protein MSMEG_3849 [Mycolicibacterium smegmatis MC2 155]|uniref:Uncharacterized protein n=1 Tax=Mycolicibacterium smegmatis (strain ATCC 700084 / mc(2)155) TaxID=246196 RepID=A0QZ02_MYCS2|nr:hypothetical protein MSMEG_3849 [Mycolicibacterium smegmatis MC2 155]
MAVAHAGPRLGGLRCPQAQRADGRPGVRDGTPAMYAVSREPLDDPGADLCADGAFVHEATVAESGGRMPDRAPRRRARVRSTASLAECGLL